MQKCPSRYTSDQQGASCQPGCEPCDQVPRFNPPSPSFRIFLQKILLLLLHRFSVCELILCSQRPGQTLHKMASALLCEHFLALLA